MTAGPGRTPGETIEYESTRPWDPERPQTLIICCVDGRWFGHFEEFARVHLGAGPRTDFLAVPGGVEPLTLLDLVPKDFNFFRRRIEGLIQAHGTRRIAAIGHQDCAWYRTRLIGRLIRADLRERQVADLRRSRGILREMFPGIAVETYFARLSGTTPEKVRFEAV